MQDIIVLVYVADEAGDDEFEKYEGYLVQENYAVYVDEYNVVSIMEVEKSEVDGVYIAASGSVEIGHVNEGEDERQVIEGLVRYMQNTSLFDYIIYSHDFREACDFDFTEESGRSAN